MEAWRKAVVDEALSWVYTPYHHMAMVKGAGVDCLMLLVGVYAVGCKLIPVPIVPYYPEQWHLHKSEERYLEGIMQYCVKTETPQPADIAMYKFGRAVSHAAIIISDALMVHSYKFSKCVELCERHKSLPHGKLDSYWTLKAVLT